VIVHCVDISGNDGFAWLMVF